MNFIRSLRDSGEKFEIFGVDNNKYNLQRAETDKKALVPSAKHECYIDVLNDIIDANKLEFIHAQPDIEVFTISKFRDKLHVNTFLPKHKTVEICTDKFKSYSEWRKNNIKTPRTTLLRDEEDLKKAFEEYGGKVWVREVSGAAGKNSFSADNFNLAKAWIDWKNGWGIFTAAECLTSQSTTWLSIWKDGELIVAQGRKRLYWEFANRAPSGVTGITGTGITVSDAQLDEIAQKTIFAVDKKPNGIFGVDLTYDQEGVPNPTEINIGRFFTTHYFFTKAGLNMPYIYTKLAYGEEPPEIKPKINPLPDNLCWVRGMDAHPVLATKEKIDSFEKDLEKRINEI
jgi:carbamoyl-phosphate synthase large subunit